MSLITKMRAASNGNYINFRSMAKRLLSEGADEIEALQKKVADMEPFYPYKEDGSLKPAEPFVQE